MPRGLKVWINRAIVANFVRILRFDSQALNATKSTLISKRLARQAVTLKSRQFETLIKHVRRFAWGIVLRQPSRSAVEASA